MRNSGVRCITTPCPFYTAHKEGAPEGTDDLRVHELDLSALGLSEEKQAELVDQTNRVPGLEVEASVTVQPDAGPAGAATVLRISRVLQAH